MNIPRRMNAPRRVNTRKSTMFPHIITIYNVDAYTDPHTSKEVLTNYITILRGVLLDESKAVNVRESGLVGADAVNLYIPLDVKAVDGITGTPKTYLSPVEFWKADDKSKFWTMSVGVAKSEATSGSCFFIKGEAVHPDESVDKLEMMYGGNVYDITTIDTKDFGGLQHWEVGAN